MAVSKIGSDGFLVEFGPGPQGQIVIIEDDGKTAYAYFLNSSREITGDVWLYNRGKAPLVAPWKEFKTPPFANPESYVENCDTFVPPVSSESFTVRWQSETGETANAFVLLDGSLLAVVASGQRPGWSKFARKDGPLAKRLDAAREFRLT